MNSPEEHYPIDILTDKNHYQYYYTHYQYQYYYVYSLSVVIISFEKLFLTCSPQCVPPYVISKYTESKSFKNEMKGVFSVCYCPLKYMKVCLSRSLSSLFETYNVAEIAKKL